MNKNNRNETNETEKKELRIEEDLLCEELGLMPAYTIPMVPLPDHSIQAKINRKRRQDASQRFSIFK